MGDKRQKPEEIVTKLRQVEVLCGQGMPRVDAIRQVQITEQPFYRWRKQYGHMGTDQLKELKRLQKENDRLRRAVSDLTLDKLILPGPAQEGEVVAERRLMRSFAARVWRPCLAARLRASPDR
ncbi:transposase IS3 [Leisingera methylohalidivorans DSM 14336]|uniref:Transposase IS3 n=1 Tax=Leisingera methylohalidivorans DSM 14336 TaxID=999552 RepID=V9W0V8_9RHOB|nr:transposase IS3 [Leisingera methylohalidivorans DSM 14336]